MFKKRQKENTTQSEILAPSEVKSPITISLGHKIEFYIEQVVYLKTDRDQIPRIVTAIELRPHNCVGYALREGTEETYHYAFEINTERDILLLTT